MAEYENREELRKELQCIIHPLNSLKKYKYVAVCTFYNGKYVLSRHKLRSTWETQGGHIEENETPLDTAKRELFEESGIRDADIYPVCDYYGFNSKAHSNGVILIALAHSMGELPKYEMKEIGVFDELPEELTYPKATPIFFKKAKEYCKNVLHIEI